MKAPKFYVLIIGTEILNRRRADKHFDFISQELLSRGHKLSGVFTVADDPKLISKTIKFISSLSNSVLFSFGGIGSTPDDFTRQAASKALSNGKLKKHKRAQKVIAKNVDLMTHPHAINMAMLPSNAKLLKNSVNNMPAFYLDDRYFFMPGFPQMSHPMVKNIMDKFFKDRKKPYSYTLTALCKESLLIDIMRMIPKGVEFSSLPKQYQDGYRTTIYVASQNKKSAKNAFKLFTDKLDLEGIYYSIDDL